MLFPQNGIFFDLNYLQAKDLTQLKRDFIVY